jgi:8-oxo-dGTP diphosphatase
MSTGRDGHPESRACEAQSNVQYDENATQATAPKVHAPSSTRSEECVLDGVKLIEMPKINFCFNCGAPIDDRGAGTHPHCDACDQTSWRNSKPGAGAIITNASGRVLMVKRAIEPFRGWWDLPGGFLEPTEHPSRAAIREAREELGVEVQITELIGMYVDTYQDATESILSVYYSVQIVSGTPSPADDALEIGWFGVHELPENIAFQSARDALTDFENGTRRIA